MSYLYEDDGYMTDLSVSLNATAPNSVYTITGGAAGQILTGGGVAGQVLTAGANGSSAGWGTISIDSNLKGSTLNVKGDAEFQGDVIIKGKSINDSLDRIEERLAILRPNEELEAKWENLRGLRKAYMELEAEIIEKEKVWNILKK